MPPSSKFAGHDGTFDKGEKRRWWCAADGRSRARPDREPVQRYRRRFHFCLDVADHDRSAGPAPVQQPGARRDRLYRGRHGRVRLHGRGLLPAPRRACPHGSTHPDPARPPVVGGRGTRDLRGCGLRRHHRLGQRPGRLALVRPRRRHARRPPRRVALQARRASGAGVAQSCGCWSICGAICASSCCPMRSRGRFPRSSTPRTSPGTRSAR